MRKLLTVVWFCTMVTMVPAQAPGDQPGQDEEPQDSSQQIADRILHSKKPVLVDFWAVWCGPCRMLNPTLKKLETEFKGKVEFIKVNIDIHREISAYFHVQGIPAIFLIKDRTVQKALVGLQPEDIYRDALKEILAKPAAPPQEEKKPGDSSLNKKPPKPKPVPEDSL